MDKLTHAADTAPIPLEPYGDPARDGRTPAGLQDRRDLATRRLIVILLNAVTLAALTWGIWNAFAPGGWSVADIVILVCFFIGAPWGSGMPSSGSGCCTLAATRYRQSPRTWRRWSATAR